MSNRKNSSGNESIFAKHYSSRGGGGESTKNITDSNKKKRNLFMSENLSYDDYGDDNDILDERSSSNY